MKKLIFVALAVTLLSGCAVRSISNSGFQEEGWFGSRSSNSLYKGELTEFEVLGVDASAKASEQSIQAALQASSTVSLRKGDAILVVQSGALIPDDPMVRALERYFNVSIFSGVPQEKYRHTVVDYSTSLRLAAAKGGHHKIFVYWGMLESGHKDLATKTVSWFPFVGNLVPDETQQMRIRLKVAVVDVATGSWVTYMPSGFDDTATSAGLTRMASDQTQVQQLKEKSYLAAVDDLVKRYVR